MVRRERQVDRRGENESDSIHCCRVRYTVHCTLYTVHCTLYGGVLCAVYDDVRCATYSYMYTCVTLRLPSSSFLPPSFPGTTATASPGWTGAAGAAAVEMGEEGDTRTGRAPSTSFVTCLVGGGEALREALTTHHHHHHTHRHHTHRRRGPRVSPRASVCTGIRAQLH